MMNLLKKILVLALVPVLFLKASEAGTTEGSSSRFSNHRRNHHWSRERERSGHEHRYSRVGGRPSSQQNFPERVAQPVVTAGGTVADVGEDIVDVRPGEAVRDTAQGAGETAKNILAIPFGGRRTN